MTYRFLCRGKKSKYVYINKCVCTYKCNDKTVNQNAITPFCFDLLLNKPL